jgi:GTP cyclohydrolase II
MASGEVVWHRLTLQDLGSVEVAVSPFAGSESQAAVAICYGDWKNSGSQAIPVRIQSACAYGEVFNSTDCDCSEQLCSARRKIREAGAGILIYLPQEGRGLGPIVKAMAYRHSGMNQSDPSEAYAELSFSVDAREYSCAVDILARLGVFHICLLTNNPAKFDAFNNRFELRREELWTEPLTDAATRYRLAKIARGHIPPLQRPMGTTNPQQISQQRPCGGLNA